MSTVLVTGGSGFIGSHLILQLLAAGHQVRTTVRSLKREVDVRAMLNEGGAVPGDGLSFIAADLEKDTGWKEAVAGCEYVLHVASPLPPNVPKHEDELIVPAREGTLRVLRASREGGVKRMVLTSSFAAIGYGHAPLKTPFNETNWTNLNGHVTAYVKSKTIAERAAWDFMAEEGGNLELSVVNPVGVRPSTGARLCDLDPYGAALNGRRGARLPTAPFWCRRCARRRGFAHPRHDSSRGQGGTLPCYRWQFHVDARRGQAAEGPHGRVGQESADQRTAQLGGAHRRAARFGGEADSARARQSEERDQRKSQSHLGLDAALERGSYRRNRRKLGSARTPQGQSPKKRLKAAQVLRGPSKKSTDHISISSAASPPRIIQLCKLHSRAPSQHQSMYRRES
jgi:hypothetical protein